MKSALEKAKQKTHKTMVIKWLQSGSKNTAIEWYKKYQQDGGMYPFSYFVKKYFKK